MVHHLPVSGWGHRVIGGWSYSRGDNCGTVSRREGWGQVIMWG